MTLCKVTRVVFFLSIAIWELVAVIFIWNTTIIGGVRLIAWG